MRMNSVQLIYDMCTLDAPGDVEGDPYIVGSRVNHFKANPIPI